MRYYKIYVDNTKELYTYEDREDNYEIGDRVIVSFRGKQRTGLIIARDSDEEKNYKVLPIQKRMENSIKLTENYIKLLVWIKQYYMSTYEQVITAAIPSGLSVKYEKLYYPRDIVEFLQTEVINGEIREYFRKRVSVTKGALSKNFGLEKINSLLQDGLLLRDGKVNIVLDYSKILELEKREKIIYEYFKRRERIREDTLEKIFPKKELDKLVRAGDLRLEKFIKGEEEKVEEI